MEKILFVVLCLLATTNLMAQMVFTEAPLKEAIAQAKKEDKIVMVIASTTWCGPCKRMKDTIYPLQEVGDYINKRIISIATELDTSDTDNIVEKYKIAGYPTYLFINGNGEEVGRIFGSSADAKEFISKVEKTISNDNSWEKRAERYAKDPIGYAEEYFKILNDARRLPEANAVLYQIFKRRTLHENVSEENLKYYNKQLLSISDSIYTYLINNEKEIDKILGKGVIREYLQETANMEYIRTNVNASTSEDFAKILVAATDHKILKTPVYDFVSIFEQYIDNDYSKLLKLSAKQYKKLAPTYRSYCFPYFISAWNRLRESERVEYADDYIVFLDKYLDMTEPDKTRFINIIRKNVIEKYGSENI